MLPTLPAGRSQASNGYERTIKGSRRYSGTGCFRLPFLIVAFAVLILNGCKKSEVHHLLNGFDQTNLVSDTTSFGATVIDPDLVNAWGLAVAPSGPIWISDNGTGLSSVFDKSGGTVRPAVTIPRPDSPAGGAPTGVIFNGTSDFMIPSGKLMIPSRFIFATEDGTIVAWGAGNSAVIASDQSPSGAVYKGIAMAVNGGSNFLYATNFHNGTIDVFDKSFTLQASAGFMDPALPAGFAPFNIRNFDGLLFVTYAKQKPDHHDDTAGPGNGFVDIYKPDGTLVRRFASMGPLNSPWGMALVPTQLFMDKDKDKDMDPNVILVSNFGDGTINVFDKLGNFIGPLKDEGKPIVIDGIWAIENNVPNARPGQLFFTAGPFKESHGLFGYLEKK